MVYLHKVLINYCTVQEKKPPYQTFFFVILQWLLFPEAALSSYMPPLFSPFTTGPSSLLCYFRFSGSAHFFRCLLYCSEHFFHFCFVLCSGFSDCFSFFHPSLATFIVYILIKSMYKNNRKNFLNFFSFSG